MTPPRHPEPAARLHLFRGRPPWAIAALAIILVAAALLYTWNIGYSGLSTYYAASAVSMAGDPHAFLVGALNRSVTVTLDKLSGFLVPQAIAVRLFGVHAWALSLPQAVEGVVTVFAAYVLGVRWRGPAIGVATAAAVAFTPMLAAMFGRPMEDGMLTMATALAMVAAQRAMLTSRAVWLLAAAAWVAVGFQAKMLQSWFVLPAVLALYAVGAVGPLRRRLLIVLGAAGAAVLLSVGWITVIQLLPAAQRPYADGTTNGNFFSMVFGYNGVDRLVPGLVPGSVPQLGAGGGQSTGAPILPTRMESAMHSPVKLLLPEIATQIGWLYPLAAAGILAEALRRPRRRIDIAMLTGLVLWIGVTALLLAPAQVPHATYFGMIAVPIALLAVVGGAAALRLRLDDVPRRRWIASALCLAVAAWDIVTIAFGPTTLAPVGGAVAVLGVAGAALLAPPARRLGRPLLGLGVAVAVAATAVPPVLWSSLVLTPDGGGSASDAYAGPRITPSRPHAASTALAAGRHIAPHPVDLLRAPFEAPHDPELTPAQRRLVGYVVRHAGGTRPLFATDTLAIAVSVILETHYDAIPMGGFSRQAPTPTLPQLQGDLGGGTIRYVLLADPAVPQPPNADVQSIRTWVRTTCRPVLHGRFREGSPEHQTLYDCAGARGGRPAEAGARAAGLQKDPSLREG